MNRETMVDRDVVDAINGNFVAVSVDVDQNEQLAGQLQIQSVPTVLVISPTGQVLERLTGFQTSDQLLRVIAPRQQQDRSVREPSYVTQRFSN